jgi:hypothetical protein
MFLPSAIITNHIMTILNFFVCSGLYRMYCDGIRERVAQLEQLTRRYNHVLFFINGLIQRRAATDQEMEELAKLVGYSSAVYAHVRAALQTGFRCTVCHAEFVELQQPPGASEPCLLGAECEGREAHCYKKCCAGAR